MILDRKHISLIVQVINKQHFNAAGGYAEGRVLDSLKFMNMGQSVVGEPNGSCIHKKKINNFIENKFYIEFKAHL